MEEQMLDDLARELFNEHKRVMNAVIAAGHPWRFEFTIVVDGEPRSFVVHTEEELEAAALEAFLFFRMSGAEVVQRLRAAGYTVVRAQ